MTRPRPQADLDQAYALLNQDLSYYAVAKIMGCSRYWLQKHFPGRGIYREPVSDLDKDRARQWLDQGVSYKEVGRRLGVRGSTVAAWWPGCHPGPRRLTDKEVARADQMLADGCSYREVGRTIGCNSESIRLRLPGRGWTEEQRLDHIRALRDLTDDHWIWGGKQDRRATFGREAAAKRLQQDDLLTGGAA